MPSCRSIGSSTAGTPTRGRWWIVAAGLFVAWGCRDRAPPAVTPAAPLERKTQGSIEREDWEILFLTGARVGYSRTTFSRQEHHGGQLLRIDGESRMTLLRQGTPIAARIYSSSLHTRDGELVECAHSVDQDTSTLLRCEARVDGRRLLMKLVVAGKEQLTSCPWEKSYGGYHALYQTLRAAPMKPGEKRAFYALAAEANAVVANRLEAKQWETVDLLDGRRELLRIDTVMDVPPKMLPGVVWVDRAGEVWKTSPGAGMESFRSTKSAALDDAQPVEVDVMDSLKVAVAKPIQRPQQTKRVRYRVRLANGDPAAVFVSGAGQMVESVDAHTADVTVYALRAGDRWGNPKAKDDPPGDADRQANSWVQSDAPEIVAAAKQAAGDLRDPWQTALALERYTKARMPHANYTRAFDTALEALRSGAGDCSEHAVLLTALARARGIPARAAIGLVYQNGTFLYHMWVELFVDGRWIPVDAMFAQGGISAAYLKLGHTSLQGAGALASLLPITQVAGQLSIEVLDVEYR
jgi:hypothetical protein